MKTIYELGLHERISITIGDEDTFLVTRVPGGWIYEMANNSNETDFKPVFVKYHDEFNPLK